MSIISETALLSQLPHHSRIITPTAIVYVKRSDGFWYNFRAPNTYGAPLQAGQTFPDGSQAYPGPTDQVASHVKHSNEWLMTQPSPDAFRSNNTAGHPSSHGASASSFSGPLRILEQTSYHYGEVPTDDCVVQFNVLMSSAEMGAVEQSNRPAFNSELARRDKASIRFGFPGVRQSGYKEKQHNIQQGGVPFTRGQLAALVAREVRVLMAALQQIGAPLRSPSGRQLTFEELILVDVQRVSRGTLQPTIAIRGA